MPIDLVTGGAGFIGRHVVEALRTSGTSVRVLDLAPAEDNPDVEFVPGSILDAQRLDASMAGVRRVYHVAGIAQLWSRDRNDFDRINAEGTAMVLRAASARRVERVIHCSTEVILLPALGSSASICEATQPQLADMPGPYTRSKLRAEQAVAAAVRDGLNAVIVNPTATIGPGDRNLTPPAAMLSMFLNGRSPAYLDCTLNLVDVRDVAAGMLLAAERGRLGERYILGGHNVALHGLLALLEQNSGRPMPRRAVPPWLALSSAVVTEFIADRVSGRAPVTTLEGVRLALRSAPVDCFKARKELGYANRALGESLADAVHWVRRDGVGIAQVEAAAH